MKSVIKKVIIGSVILFVIILVLIFSNTDKYSDNIFKIEVDDLSEEFFYTNLISDKYYIHTYGTVKLQENDLKAIIDDPSVIEIHFDKNDSYSNSLSFVIKPLKEGTTSFYFETIDKSVTSNPVSLTVFDNCITSIDFSNSAYEIVLNDSLNEETVYFDVESHEDIDNLSTSLEFISEDEDVATIIYNESSIPHSCSIKAVNPGETYVYIQTINQEIQSSKLRVIVEEPETEPPTESPTEPPTKPNTIEKPNDEYIDNGRTVYVTPYGKKYHYSKSCAGKNAIAKSEDDAKNSYGPCKKCAQ